MTTARRFFVKRGRGGWVWECCLCQPPAHGQRTGPDAWHNLITRSLPRHMEHRAGHHAYVRRTYGETLVRP